MSRHEGNDFRLDLESLLPAGDTINKKESSRRPSIFRGPDHLDVTPEIENVRSIIFQSAREGNIDSLRSALKKNPGGANVPDSDKMTPLHYAARYGNYEAVELLLHMGAIPEAGNMEGDTPLHIAAKYHQGPLEISKIYDQNGKLVKDRAESERESNSATKKIIRALVEARAAIDAVNEYKLTPLHYAAMKSHIAAVQELIRRGASVHAQDVNEMTPLLLACVHGSEEVIQELIKAKSDVTKRDQRMNTVFHIVALRGEPEFLKMMMDNDPMEALKALNKVNNEGKTPMRMAVEGNHPQTLKKILEIEKKNSQKWMNREKELIHFAAEKGYLEVVKELVQAGGNRNELDSQKALPLHLAAKANQKPVVEYLLEDSNKEAVDDYGMTPLMVAVSSDSLDCVKFLIDEKADYTITDKDERTCVFVGAKYNALDSVGYILEYLKREETDRSESPDSGRPKMSIASRRTLRNLMEDDKKMMVNMADRDQNSPMHIVASNGYLEMMRLLKEHGAMITQVNEDEETALHRAAHAGATGAVRQLTEWDDRLLLSKDEMGNSALHLAAKMGHDVTTRVLLEAGADKEAKNSFEQTPLQVAVEAGKLETCQQLVFKGARVENPSDARTVLHSAAYGGDFDTLVRFLIQSGVSIDRRDENGMTALDVACERGHKEVARALLETEEWQKLMIPNDVIKLDKKGQVIKNERRTTPFRTLLDKFPDLAQLVMDKCIDKNMEEKRESQSIAYDFQFIDDTYMVKTATDDGEGEQLVGHKFPYDDEFKLIKEAEPYASNYDKIYKYHPLKLMADAGKLSLLSHPLSIALIKHKWNRLGRVMYYSALFIYLVFIISLTEFVRHTKAPYNVENGDSFYESSFFEENETCPMINVTKPHAIWKLIIQILAVCQIVIEVFQLYQRKLSYLTNWENWIDCFIYSTSLLTVYDFSDCSATSGVRQNWQWLLAALCIFFGWINLLFMIRKMPRFGIFVVMFVDIVKTFFRFFPVFVLFIIAFSSSFYVILQNRPEFSSVALSPLKTTVMMIGEFEFAGIFHGDESLHTEKMFGLAHMTVAYGLFFSFCIIMTILLMNLLVGLAVDDIKGVQEKAELKRLAMQVDLVLQIEASIHVFIRHMKYYSTCRYCTWTNKPPETRLGRWWLNFRRRFGLNTNEDTEEAAMYDYQSEFNSELRSTLQIQQNRLQNLQENIDIMYEKQVRLEALIRSLAKGMKIPIEVEENDY